MFHITLPKGDKEKIKKPKQKTDEPVTSDNEKVNEPVFNAEEKKYFLPFIMKLNGLTVYHTSDIMEVLNQMQNDKITDLQRWKEEMQTALYNCNEKRFEEILSMVK